jgi:hypothetical protein
MLHLTEIDNPLSPEQHSLASDLAAPCMTKEAPVESLPCKQAEPCGRCRVAQCKGWPSPGRCLGVMNDPKSDNRELRCGSVEDPVEGDERAADVGLRRLGAATRRVLAAVGAVVFGAGIAAVFVLEGNGGAGAAALLTIGALTVGLAGVGALPTSLGIAGVQLSFPERVKQLADEATRRGRPDVREKLLESADLWTGARPFAEAYKTIRDRVPPGDQRTAVMQILFDLVKDGAIGQWSPSQARELFETGDEGERLFALAMMRAFKRPADLDLALEGAAHPKSSFEQWQSLTLIADILPKLDRPQRDRTQHALTSLKLIGEGTGDREQKRDEILRSLH